MTLEEIDNRLLERFSKGFEKLSSIPNPAVLKDSEKGAERVAQAIKSGERITLIGDYDVDGVTSSAITHLFFQEIGHPIEVVIPNRFKDGYGITPKLLERVDSDLIITADNGIHAHKSAEILKSRGVDLIITDHHNPSDTLPDAYAVINPKQTDCPYPLKAICGAEVIWLFLAVVKRKLNINIDMMQYLDLLAVATISDVMPITDINHTIVKKGLQLFSKSKRASNQVMITTLLSKEQITAEDIAFQVAPRLNSSGRIEDASLSFRFLTAQNYDEALQLFERINRLNTERKELEKSIFNRVVESINSDDELLLYYGDDLHEGVIGIVASRLVDKFSKPAIVFSLSNGVLKGSGRSLGNVDIFKTIAKAEHLLLKWGGHKMAGGLSLNLSNFEEFKSIVISEVKNYSKEDFFSQTETFGEISFKDIGNNLIEVLNKYEPYGESNQKPIFLAKDVEVVEMRQIGKKREFLKIFVEKESTELEVLIFQSGIEIDVGEIISFEYTVQTSYYRDKMEIKGLLKRLI